MAKTLPSMNRDEAGQRPGGKGGLSQDPCLTPAASCFQDERRCHMQSLERMPGTEEMLGQPALPYSCYSLKRGLWPSSEQLQMHQPFKLAIPLAEINPTHAPTHVRQSQTRNVILCSTVGRGTRMPHNGMLCSCEKGQGGSLRTPVKWPTGHVSRRK